MPDRQKYTLRIALCPQTALEGVTYMDLKAIQDEVKKAAEKYEMAVLDCVNEDGSVVKVMVKAVDIQMIMLSEWKSPGRVMIPRNPAVQ